MIPFNDRVIYFIVTDRFFNSDPANDGGRNPLSYDPERRDWRKYWGGDLGGVMEKLGYLEEMGISALWLTPMFEQTDGLVDAAGCKIAAYHGYWAQDFKRLDPHLVSKPEDTRVFASRNTILDNLISAMHGRGMKMIYDIVCNHSSPSSEYGPHPASKGRLFDDGRLLTSYDNDTLGWYHRCGEVHDWNDMTQVQNDELCGLADFNESKIGYRNYIKDAIKLWLDKGGDALRVDTVKHMPIWFWQEFVSDMMFHKPDLFMFGEWFQGGCYDPMSVTFANHSGMGMLDFALQRAVTDCLGADKSGGFGIIDDVFRHDALFDDCHRLVTFIDNHDMPRFLSSGASEKRADMALALILTCRGTPCIYYGTEQYLHNDTGGGNDPYNRPMMDRWSTSTPAFRLIRNLAGVRKTNRAIQRGSTRIKHLSENVYAYTRVYRDYAALAIFNKGPETELSLSDIEFPDGEYKDELGALALQVRDGRTNPLRLAPDTVSVFSHIPREISQEKLRVCFQLNGYKTTPGQNIYVTGNCPELGKWELEKAFRLEYINDNLWMGDLIISESGGLPISYKFVLRDEDGFCYENRPAHSRILPDAGYMVFRHRWQ